MHTHIIAAAIAVFLGILLLKLGLEFHEFTVTFFSELEK